MVTTLPPRGFLDERCFAPGLSKLVGPDNQLLNFLNLLLRN